MKRVWSLLLALALVICLCACGGNNKETEAPTKPTEQTTEKPTEKATEATTEATTEAPTEPGPTELELLKEAYDKVPARYELSQYESQIKILEMKSQQKNGIVFYGSSGFTRWSTSYGNTPLAEALLADDGTMVCVNHGFGGSTVHQLVYNYERMVKAYEPRALVISSYLNDMSKGYTNEEIMICLKYLVELTRTDLPGIRFYITDYRPTVNGSAVGRYTSLNKEIGEYCAAHDDCTFVELSKEPFYYTDPKYCGTYTNVNAAKYVEDGVHYTPEGYQEFAEIWKKVLADELKIGGGIPVPGSEVEGGYDNLAKASLGTTVTSTYAQRQASSGLLTNIIDGDSAPNFSTSFQGIWSEDGYILFDLQSEQEIFGTRMYNYAWPYQYCINQEWSVYTSSDGENWTKQTTDSIDCSLFTSSIDYVKTVTEGKPDGSDFPAPVKARYVKLVIDKVFVGDGTESSNADVRLYEFEILGKLPTVNYAAASQGTTVTSNYEPRSATSAQLKNIIDGDSAPNFSTSFQGAWTADGYILFDMQEEREIFGTRMYNYTWPYQYCINEQWSVYTSADGENWTKQTTDSIDCSLFTSSVDYVKSVTEGKPDGSDFPEPVKARYVKLVIDKVFVGPGDNTNAPGETPNGGMNEDVRMYEFEILGKGAPVEGPKNLALDATVTSTYKLIKSDGYFPYLINDGKEADGLTACAGWNFSEDGEILFELAAESSVTGYKLVNMGEPEVYGGVKDWKVLVSADGSSWTEIDSGKGLSAGSAEKTLDAPVAAKFVKLVVVDSHCNTKLADTVADKRVIRIAEFEIFGK